MEAVTALQTVIHANAQKKGFWGAGGNEHRNMGEKIALMHAELSEALEAHRVSGDIAPDKHCPEFNALEVEFADCIIRILDTAAAFKLRVPEAILAKVRFNQDRPYLHSKSY